MPWKRARTAGATAVAAPTNLGIGVQGGLKTSFAQKQLPNGGLRITGRSFITTVDNTDRKKNNILVVWDVNPALLNDRVAAISTTYEKYVYQQMTFHYIPQCATTTPGSIMMTFERDASMPCADPDDTTTFMQNVMSYENTITSPPWTPCSITFKRETAEKKLFNISNPNAQYDTRDTSQGQLLVYGANTPVTSNYGVTGLGFIVMDYVLDLEQPSILPARMNQGIGSASPNRPEQYKFVNVTSPITKLDASGASGGWNFPSVTFGANLTDCGIYEIIAEGKTFDSQITTPQWATNDFYAKTGVLTQIQKGSKLYLVVRRYVLAATNTDPNTATGAGSNIVVAITKTLSSAIGLMGSPTIKTLQTGVGELQYALHPDCFFPSSAIVTGGALNIGGFLRKISTGGGGELTDI